MPSHVAPYTATASIAYAMNLMDKLKKAKFIRGATFLHLFTRPAQQDGGMSRLFCRSGPQSGESLHFSAV